MAKRSNPRGKNKNMDDQDNVTVIKLSGSNSGSDSNNKNTQKRNTSRGNSRKTSNAPSTRKSNKPSTARKSNADISRSNKNKNKPQDQNTKEEQNTAPVQKTNEEPVLHTRDEVKISQTVAILVDGNNIEMSLTKITNNKNAVINFDHLIPKLLHGRGLNRLIYFREGRSISQKLADRLYTHYFGSVVPCHKSADIPLSIKATQLAEKVDTIIILSGDSDYVELVRHLKSQGVRVEVAAVQATTAAILIEEVDFYSPITQEDAFILK